MRRLLSILTLVLLFVASAAAREKMVVVIDAGHGGHDTGAPGSLIKEKEVNLEVAKRLGKQLKKRMKEDVKVIYTRSADSFVTLADRAEIANNANADIFVSIHSNSIGDKKLQNKVQGASVYVRGFASSQQANEVALLENSVLELEDKTRIDLSAEESVLSDLKWNKNLEQSILLASNLLDELVSTAGRRRGAVEQNDLAVLKRTRMPAVLVELEFICNPEMEKFMASDKGQDRFAEALCNGIIAYRDGSSAKPAKTTGKPAKSTAKPARTVKSEPADKTASRPAKSSKSDTGKAKTPRPEEKGLRYKVQFMTSPRVIVPGSARFKGLPDVDRYLDGTTYKYTSGSFASMSEASAHLAKVKEKFPDAFIIKMENGVRIK